MLVKNYTEYGLVQENKLINAIIDMLNNDNDDILDFSGVKYFTTSFFNSIFNRIMDKDLMSKFLSINVINLSNVGKKVYEVCLNNVLEHIKEQK